MKKDKIYKIIIKKIIIISLFVLMILFCIFFQAIYMDDNDQGRVTPLIIIFCLSYAIIAELFRIIMLLRLMIRYGEREYLFYNTYNICFCENYIYYMKNFKIYKVDYNEVDSLKQIYYTFEYPNNLVIKKYWRIYYCLFLREKKGKEHTIFINYEPKGIILEFPSDINKQKIDDQENYIISQNNNISLIDSEEEECSSLLKFLLKYSKK